MDVFRSQAPLDAAISALASGQYTVFSLDQLRALGLTANAVQLRAAEGRTHRIHRSVYSLVPQTLLTRNGRYMAAVLACGPGAVLSHRSAAALLGLRSEGVDEVEVTVPGRGRRHRAGIAVHRSTTLAPTDAVIFDGIPCTTVARTLLDVAEVVPSRHTEWMFDQAEAMQALDLGAIEDQVARNATRPGAKVVRAILVEHYIGSTLTRSEVEEAMLALCRNGGLPSPQVNEWLDLGDGGSMIKPDFMWRAQRLIVEVDSVKFHGTRQRFEGDRRRDQRAVLAGWRVIRTTDRQLARRPGDLHETIRKLLAQVS